MPRLGTLPLSVALFVLTLAAYLPLWHNGFVDLDDDWYITANPHVRTGLTADNVRWALTTFHGKYWQPLSWLALQFDAQVFSTSSESGERILVPAAYHAENLAWHLGSVLLLFAVWQRLTGAIGRSFLVAALFAIHPMRVESIAWAAERKDVLSVFFGILTLWTYARYAEKPGVSRYLAVVGAFALSLLAKPMLMTLPLVLLLLDYWPLRRTAFGATDMSFLPGLSPPPPWGRVREGGASVRELVPPTPALPHKGGGSKTQVGRLLLEKLPLFGLTAAIAIITVVARDQTNATVPLSELSVAARLANAATAYGAYVVSTFCPIGLAVLYPHPKEAWSPAAAGGGAALLVGITLVAVHEARRWPWLIVGWSWFVIGLLPVIGLAQGGPQARADRFCYWPHIGLFVAAVWSIFAVVERIHVPRLASAAASAAVLIALASLTWQLVGYWHDPETLWERALAVTTRNAEAHEHLAKYYLREGEKDKAEAHFAEAERIDPRSAERRHSQATTAMGKGLAAEGKTDWK